MDDARGVRGGKCTSSLDRDFENLNQLHPRADALAQSLTIDELSRDETRCAGRSNLVDCEDVRMIQRRCRFRLLNKSLQPLRVRSQRFGKNLASMDRFRPILMTTLAAVFGAMPIALGYGADGSSRRPLGLVVVGGLVVSQFITLYITPVIYLYLEQFQEKVLDRTSFFGSRRKPKFVSGDTQPAPQPLPSDLATGD